VQTFLEPGSMPMADFQNQRRSPRCSFVVTAEVMDENSRTLVARLRNLNLYGCYIELSNPLPEQSSVSIKVAAGKTVFQARGRVIYSDANAGSGVEFQGVEPDSQAVLETWLLEAQDVNSPENPAF
jgi:PilZ domain-containing protein